MDGNGGMPDGGGFPGAYAGFPDPAVTAMSSDSNLNNSPGVSMAGGGPQFVPQAGGDGADGAEPSAKRMKVEPATAPMETLESNTTVANMAAIAASRATGLQPTTMPIGSGMSTEQFLQALPTAYSKPPAYMVMLQQQQQQAQQQQQQQAQQQQQLHAQRQMLIQRQLAIQQQMLMQQRQQVFQQQLASQSAASAQAQAAQASQAHAIMMAAMAQNRLVQAQQQQAQVMKQEPKLTFTIPAASAGPLGGAPPKMQQPTDDPSCFVCKEKGDDLFVCSYACGVAAHARCIGKDKVVSLGPDKTICAGCSLMHQDRNAQENLHKGGTVGISVRRAILYINMETTSNSNFDKFGHLTSLRLYEIAQIAGYPIGPYASRFIEPLLQRWMTEKLTRIAAWPMTVRDVFTMMIGLYSLDRVGINHGWRAKALEVIQAKNYSTTDFLGWHPAIEPPTVCSSSLCSVCCIRNPPEVAHCARCRRPLMFPSLFTKYSSALLAAYYAEFVGIGFGATFLDVFAHLPTVRSHYKGAKPFDPNGYEWDMFVDQMRMIFGVVDIASNFGVLELDPDLFDAEATIIFNQQHVNQAMIHNDFEVAGKFLQCMKLFGKQRANQFQEVINHCERFMLHQQQPNGSWFKTGSTVIDQFKSSVVCAKALVNPVIRGRGPSSSDMRRLLVKWAKKTPGNQHAKRAEQLGNGRLLAAGVTVTGRTVPNLKRLEVFYRRQIVPTSGLNSLETLATARLRAIWSAQKPEPQEDEVKDELAATATDSEDADASATKTEKAENGDGVGAAPDDDDTLIKLSLSGELSLFDGLKFEDGDVIDISSSRSGEAEDDENGGVVKAEDDEVEDRAESAQADEDQEDAADTEDDVYDDDDDVEGENVSQLPEPDLSSELAEGESLGDMGVGEVDMSGLDGDLQLDEAYAHNSMDLAMDM